MAEVTIAEPADTEVENFGERAPIVEALLDLRVAPRADLDLGCLEDLVQELRNAGYEVLHQHDASAEVRFDQDGATAATSARRHIGFIARAPSDRHVVQLQHGGFAFSRLRPYDSWSDVKDAAAPIWKRYVECAAPAHVSRCALRYINLFQFEQDEIVPAEWFKTYPRIAEGSSLPIRHFEFRAVVGIDGLDALVGMRTARGSGPGIILSLDIDVSELCNLAPDDPKIWDKLDQLRTIKNKLFFGSISERMKEKLRND